jgi:hypothetical protein
MQKSIKYNAYKQAFSLMKIAKENKSLPYSIASIAIAESIISDRMQSYISYKEKHWYENKKNLNIGSKILADKCEIHFTRLHIKSKSENVIIESMDLFNDIKLWLKSRNIVLHSFTKSNHGLNMIEFSDLSFITSEEGLKLCSLISKWFKQQKL